MYHEFETTIRSMLVTCRSYIKSGHKPIEHIEFLPILGATGYRRTVEKKEKNFTDFINSLIPDLKNNNEYRELNKLLSNRSEFQKYYAGKLLAVDGTVIQNPTSKDIEPWVGDFIFAFLINYLYANNSFIFNKKNFSEIYKSLKNHVSRDYNTKYFFIPLYNFCGTFSKLQIINNMEIARATPNEYARIVNMIRSFGRIKTPPYKFWRVRYVLRGRFLNDKNSANKRAEKEFDKVLAALRLYKTGQVQLGSMYQFSPGNWDHGQVVLSNNNVPVQNLSLYYNMYKHEGSFFVKFYQKYRKIDFDSKEFKFIATAIRRFEAAIENENSEDKIINFVICLESLLLEDEGELQYRLSLRLAYLLAKDDPRREFLWKFCKESYKLRSRIVHGKPRKPFKIDGKQYADEEVVKELDVITREVIKCFLLLIQKYKNQEKLLDSLDLGLVNSLKLTKIRSSIA